MRSAFFVILLIATVAYASSWSLTEGDEFSRQPCAGYLAEIEADNLLVRVNGTRFMFYVPEYKGGPFGSEPVEYLEAPSLREQNRSSNACSRLTDKTISEETFEGCSCTLIAISEVAQGVNKTGYSLRIDRCPAPQQNLVFLATASVTNVTVSQIFTDTMQYSYASNFSYSSPAGAIKFGVHINDFHWTDTTNNSYLALPLRFGVRGHQKLQIVQTNVEDYQVVADFENFQLRLNLDWGYVLNGRGAFIRYRFDDDVTDLPGNLGDIWFGFDSAVSFCQPLPHDVGLPDAIFEPLDKWNDIYYDPSLQIIFGDVSNLSPKQPRPSRILPVAIAVPLGVAAIVVLIVVLTLTVPSFRRRFITSFDKRAPLTSGESLRPHPTTEPSAGASSRPSQSTIDAQPQWKAPTLPEA